MDQGKQAAHRIAAQCGVRITSGFRFGDRTLAVAPLHIRVGLIDDEGVRPGFPHGPQQIQIGHAEAAAAHGGVVFHLPWHEDNLFSFRKLWRQSGAEAGIVFGQPIFQNQDAQSGGAFQQCGTVRVFRHGVEDVFQFAGPGRIVINALSVHHQGIGPVEIRTQPHGADEAVLHARQRDSRIVTFLLQRRIHAG